MNDITRILSRIEEGDPSEAGRLLPLIYGELRQLAAAKMRRESPDNTLDATGLVHEAYLRLVDVDKVKHWNSRGHFFAAASEAMRRILVDNARRRKSAKRGGTWERIGLNSELLTDEAQLDEVLDISAALDQLADEDSEAAELVKLRFFAGCSLPEAAELMGIARSTAYEQWSYARAWLRCAIGTLDD